MPNNISIKQIARLTGLSVATVSRVINHKGYYSQEAEEKVRAIVDEYNYVPNMIARSLKTNRTDTIGIIIPDINGDFFSKAVVRLQLSFFSRGYSTIIFNTNHDLKLAAACLNMMRSNQVSGIVDFTGTVGKDISASVPVLYFDRKPEHASDAAYIISDGNHGGFLAGRALIKAGCKRMAVMTPQYLYSNHRERLAGFLDALHQEGIAQDQVLHIKAEGFTIADGCDAACKMLEETDCDGIFAVSDYLTTGIMQAVSSRGVPVPEQLRIVGYDVDTVLRLITPSYTTVTQPLEQMTDLAVSHLLDMIENEKPSLYPIVLTPSLAEGQTT